MKIEWHGFLDQVIAPERAKQTSCGLIFSDAPFSKDETCDIVEVQVESFGLNPIDFTNILKEAKENQKTRVGNAHTHIFFEACPKLVLCTPNCPNHVEDIVRGVIVVVFSPVMQHYDPARNGLRFSGRIENVFWHDKFGEQLNLNIE